MSKNILSETSVDEAKGARQTASAVPGRILALDLGERRVGLAVSDELQITVNSLKPLLNTNWKKLLRAVKSTIEHFDARALVIGLPLNLNGTEGIAAREARRRARNFALSLTVPVYLQDERLTSVKALENLRDSGLSADQIRARVDSEAAAIILHDFIATEMKVDAVAQDGR